MACIVPRQPLVSAKCDRPEPTYVGPNDLRTIFAHAMSAMYREEVPLYSDLVRIVERINSENHACSQRQDSIQRLSLERHGAIRLGTPYELRTIKRLFGLLGMQAVGYYDLSVAGLPMHATCFRPTTTDCLEANPFRVFTTLLRPELLKCDESKSIAESLLQSRSIFTPALLDILDAADEQGGRLTVYQLEIFIPEALSTFSWQPVAAAKEDQYIKLRNEHPILADIACFQSAHINHLTPRVLDIDLAKQAMDAAGMPTKASIEGPPRRNWPILLRQTSFLALEERIQFRSGSDSSGQCRLTSASHKARFGEIEERGAALTPKGRKLYDDLFHEADIGVSSQDDSGTSRDEVMVEVFQRFPDDWTRMCKEGLVYCTYRCTQQSLSLRKDDALPATVNRDTAKSLAAAGLVESHPIVYEDFLPFSAAGIFQSNLGKNRTTEGNLGRLAYPDQEGLETALGCRLIDADDLYMQAESESLRNCAQSLGIPYGP